MEESRGRNSTAFTLLPPPTHKTTQTQSSSLHSWRNSYFPYTTIILTKKSCFKMFFPWVEKILNVQLFDFDQKNLSIKCMFFKLHRKVFYDSYLLCLWYNNTYYFSVEFGEREKKKPYQFRAIVVNHSRRWRGRMIRWRCPLGRGNHTRRHAIILGRGCCRSYLRGRQR